MKVVSQEFTQRSLTGLGGPWATAYSSALEDSRDGYERKVDGLVGWNGKKG